jgi:hypothetical protein
MIISELPSSVAVLPIVADVVIGDWPGQMPPSGTNLITVPLIFLDVAIGDWPGQSPPAK